MSRDDPYPTTPTSQVSNPNRKSDNPNNPSGSNPFGTGPSGGGGSTGGGKYLGVGNDYSVINRGIQPHPHMPYPQYAHGFNYTTQTWGANEGRQGAFTSPNGRPQPTEFKPLYKSGDEFKPSGFNTDDIIDMQTKLVVAHYLSAEDHYELGNWDEPTVNAYRQLLEDANGAGVDADAMVRHRIENAQALGGSGHQMIDPNTGEIVDVPYQAKPLQLDLPNRDDLRRVFMAAAKDKLGQALPDAQVEDMVNAYIWKNIQYQAEGNDFENAMGRADWEGTAPPTQLVREQPPTAEAFGEAEAQRRDPEGYQATQAYDYSQEFYNALGGYT